MSYTVLSVLAVIMAVVADQWVLRTHLLATRDFWLAEAIVVFFQLVVNGVLTGLPVVRYDPGTILGPRVSFAPVEDLGFGFALVTLTLACWELTTARDSV